MSIMLTYQRRKRKDLPKDLEPQRDAEKDLQEDVELQRDAERDLQENLELQGDAEKDLPEDSATVEPQMDAKKDLQKDPKPQKRRRQKFPTSWDNEKCQVKSFSLTTRKNLENRIEKKHVALSISELQEERGKIFEVGNLPVQSSNCIVLDKNGEPLLYFLKEALRWPFEKFDPTVDGLETLQTLVGQYPPHPPKSTDVRHKNSGHLEEHGVYHFALWHPKGHEYEARNETKLAKGAMISLDVIKVGYKFNETMEFLLGFTPISQAVGALFEVVDQVTYRRYKAKFDEMAKKTAITILRTTSRSCFLGMAILVGLACKPHRDSKDSKDGWVADLAFGNFQGGHLEVPQLGFRLDLKQKDKVFMRSNLLQHSVSKITDGLRFGVV